VPTGRSHPDARRAAAGRALALPDVGGTSGMQNRDLTVHGSDGRGYDISGRWDDAQRHRGRWQRAELFNEAMFQEISYQTSAINAEVSAGGVRANMIPKDGGNQLKGSLFFSEPTRGCSRTTATRLVRRAWPHRTA